MVRNVSVVCSFSPSLLTSCVCFFCMQFLSVFRMFLCRMQFLSVFANVKYGKVVLCFMHFISVFDKDTFTSFIQFLCLC